MKILITIIVLLNFVSCEFSNQPAKKAKASNEEQNPQIEVVGQTFGRASVSTHFNGPCAGMVGYDDNCNKQAESFWDVDQADNYYQEVAAQEYTNPQNNQSNRQFESWRNSVNQEVEVIDDRYIVNNESDEEQVQEQEQEQNQPDDQPVVQTPTEQVAQTSAFSIDVCRVRYRERTYRYCIKRDLDSRNYDVLYVFHGANGSEQDIYENDDVSEVIEMMRDTYKGAPTIVSVSFGDFWLLSHQQAGRSSSGLYEYFLNNIMPEIEAELPYMANRQLLGVSMGGFNSLLLTLKNGSLFKKSTAICPAIPEVGPYSSFGELLNYMTVNKVDYAKYGPMFLQMRSYFNNHVEWIKGSPYNLVEGYVKANTTPKMYVSVARDDEVGIYTSVDRFVQRSREYGANITWKPTWGGHCVFNHQEIVDFILY